MEEKRIDNTTGRQRVFYHCCRGVMHIIGPHESDFEKRQRIFRNYVNFHDNCIALKIDHGIEEDLSPFGFHFELDKQRYAIRRREIRRLQLTKWFHWIALYHHKYGIRHFLLVCLIVVYTAIGGAIFNAIESPYEKKELKEIVETVYLLIHDLANTTINIAMSNESSQLKQDEITVLIQDYYKIMLDAEGRYKGSALHKDENLQLRRTWHYGSAVFYAATLFTTIGYGTISCHTLMGQVISLIYAVVGVPIMLAVVGDVGTLFLRLFTWIYVILVIKCRQIIMFLKTFRKPEKCVSFNEEFQLPISVSFIIAVFYVFMCACVVSFFDMRPDSKDNISLWGSFYFSTISFLTIGLGDVMPDHIQYSPWVILMYLLGLAIVGMVNGVAYKRLETSFFAFISILEKKLDHIHAEHHPYGFEVFRNLTPLIEIYALALPNIPDAIEVVACNAHEQRSIAIQTDASNLDLTPHQPKINRVQSAHFRRSSPIVQQRQRAPTLGVFNTNFDPVNLKFSDL